MKNYLELLALVLNEGVAKTDRTKVGTRSIFGHQLRFNLEESFPLVTTKKIFFRSVVYELLWFLRGESNIKYLNDHNVHIWDAWADTNGELGPVYGVQWRKWNNKIDQIRNLIDNIKNNPDSRRHIISAWNPEEIDNMALPPCHVMFQFYVVNGELSCQLYQRSADIFLGVPFNIASYSLLTLMVAQVCNLKPKEFIHTFGDVHLYSNHIKHAELQLTRVPKQLPNVELNKTITDIFDFNFEDIVLKNYLFDDFIKAEIAI